MQPIAWLSKPIERLLADRLSSAITVVSSAREFIDAQRDARTVSFLDGTTLAALDKLAQELGASHDGSSSWRQLLAAVSLGPVIAICEEPFTTATGWLAPHPWLCHVLSASLLALPMGKEHLQHLMQVCAAGIQPRLMDWLGSEGSGRRVRMTHAKKRTERLDKMSDFFGSHGVAKDDVARLREAASELLTNAFYDAPVAAGVESKPIDPSYDVALPEDCACDLAYGTRPDLAVVRVRDPFGSLTRERLVEALARPQGHGLQRVFSLASLATVSVIGNRQTEVFFAVAKGGRGAERPYAFDVFFKGGAKRQIWKLVDEDTGSVGLTGGTSVTLTMMPE